MLIFKSKSVNMYTNDKYKNKLRRNTMNVLRENMQIRLFDASALY